MDKDLGHRSDFNVGLRRVFRLACINRIRYKDFAYVFKLDRITTYHMDKLILSGNGLTNGNAYLGVVTALEHIIDSNRRVRDVWEYGNNSGDIIEELMAENKSLKTQIDILHNMMTV